MRARWAVPLAPGLRPPRRPGRPRHPSATSSSPAGFSPRATVSGPRSTAAMPRRSSRSARRSDTARSTTKQSASSGEPYSCRYSSSLRERAAALAGLVVGGDGLGFEDHGCSGKCATPEVDSQRDLDEVGPSTACERSLEADQDRVVSVLGLLLQVLYLVAPEDHVLASTRRRSRPRGRTPADVAALGHARPGLRTLGHPQCPASRPRSRASRRRALSAAVRRGRGARWLAAS